MASYKLTMEMTCTMYMDTGDWDAFQAEYTQPPLDANDPKEVHKYVQKHWGDMFELDGGDGKWELNSLKVDKNE